MRVIICGGRHYRFTKADRERLDALHALHDIVEVIHGGARGADTDADEWARDTSIAVTIFEAQWDRDGKSAGPIRNTRMLNYLLDHPLDAQMVIAFPGGMGTANMLGKALVAGIPIHEVIKETL